MPFIEWTQALSVDVDVIDGQHRELFVRVNALVDAMSTGSGQAEMTDLVQFLADYVRIHFAAEEGLMAETLYPGFEQHRGEHAEFERDFAALSAEFSREGPKAHLLVKLNNRVCLWLVSHIKRSDLALGRFLKRHANGTLPLSMSGQPPSKG